MRYVLAVFIIGICAITAAIAAAATEPRPPVTAFQRAPDPVQGQKVYIAQKCNICHVVAGVGGKLGPDLSGIGLTRTAAWLEKYLPDPRAFNPKGKMPAQSIKGQDLKDLAAYLATLKTKK
jgi:cytochrome c2